MGRLGIPRTHAHRFPIWSKVPFRFLYIHAKIFSLLVLIPTWAVYCLPAKNRGRPSWTLKESIVVRIISWVMPLNAIGGQHLMSTNKTREVPDRKLKESSFIWLEPATEDLLHGAADDDEVERSRVPGYVWPKGATLGQFQGNDRDGLVCLFIHGGGYMMGNAGEKYPELDIARQLLRKTKVSQVLSVDYRLAHEGRHPTQLIDALAGYAHLLRTASIDPKRVVVAGACAGGHLALMLIRYLVDEKVLPLPGGLMLFSPWVDMQIDEEIAKGIVKGRPNSNIDLLNASVHANLRFIGDKSIDLFDTPLLSANRSPPGSFTAYPKTFLAVGECDSFHQECDQLQAKMKGDGADVIWDVQPDAVHDYFGFGEGAPNVRARENVMATASSWLDRLSQK